MGNPILCMEVSIITTTTDAIVTTITGAECMFPTSPQADITTRVMITEDTAKSVSDVVSMSPQGQPLNVVGGFPVLHVTPLIPPTAGKMNSLHGCWTSSIPANPEASPTRSMTDFSRIDKILTAIWLVLCLLTLCCAALISAIPMALHANRVLLLGGRADGAAAAAHQSESKRPPWTHEGAIAASECPPGA